MKGAVVTAMLAENGSRGTLSWVVLILAGIRAVVAASMGRLLALGVWVFWAFALFASDPASVMEKLAG